MNAADWPATAYARLYLDSGLNHSSGYFDHPGMSLDDAQRAKIGAILDRCQVGSGDRLLDIGSGWGTAAGTAASEYGARVTGLTLDREQQAYARQAHPTVDFRVQSWETFDERVDRIICVNAFENFRDKHGFLPHCRTLLAPGGIMVMLTVTADRPMFRVVSRAQIVEAGRRSGFDVHVSDSLAGHYVRTLEQFAGRLTARRREAAAIRSESEVDRHIAYYEQCAGFLRSGLNDMFEFTFVAR